MADNRSLAGWIIQLPRLRSSGRPPDLEGLDARALPADRRANSKGAVDEDPTRSVRPRSLRLPALSRLSGAGRQGRRLRQGPDAEAEDPRRVDRRGAGRRGGQGPGLWPRERRARGRRHAGDDLSVGLGRQAVHGHAGDDAGPGRQAGAGRSREQVHRGGARGLEGDHPAPPADAHVGDLERPLRHDRHAQGLHRGRADPADRGAAARLPARRQVELQQSRLRDARHPHPQGDGEVLRRPAAREDLRAARA